MAERLRTVGATLPAERAADQDEDSPDRSSAFLARRVVCEPVQPAEVEGDWRRLAKESPSIFSTYEWSDSWWRTCGGGRERRVLAVRAGDGVVGIVPLYRERWGAVRVLRFIADGASDELGPICRPEDRDAVADALTRYLDEHQAESELLIGRTMAGDAGWRDRLDALLLNREASPILDVSSGSWDDFLASRSSHFRQRVRAAERKLHRGHRVDYRLVTDPEELPSAIDRLVDLHRLLRAGRPSSFLRVEPFHREMIQRAHAAGWTRLWLLELDGEAVATTLEYTVDGVVHGYQMGVHPSVRSVLHVRTLVAMSLRAAFEDPSLREFRIGRGGEDYKQQFAERDPGLETVVVGTGPIGSAIAQAMYRARSARPLARRIQRWWEGRSTERGTESATS